MEKNYDKENEVDLSDLFLIIWKYKIFILLVTVIITIFMGTIYTFNLKKDIKSTKALYKASMFVEVGIVYMETHNFHIESVGDLRVILDRIFSNDVDNHNLIFNFPRNRNILEVISVDDNKINVKKKLDEVYTYILNRHKEKVKRFENYTMTEKVGEIKITEDKKDKKDKKDRTVPVILISFFTTLIFSIFLSFFIEFIKNIKNNKLKN